MAPKTFGKSNQSKSGEGGIRRLVLCSGKVYSELDKERKKLGTEDVVISRVELLDPFPNHFVQGEMKRYPNAEIVWFQEKPLNTGAYSKLKQDLSTAMKALDRKTFKDIKYIDRAPSAATDAKELTKLMRKALQPGPIN